ncbi:MAG: outer membrane protein assembly factor BamD, partial [Duncaniella sp.]|nr:outer membrane protein assembly factor BamD [Duncaniella sp.]
MRRYTYIYMLLSALLLSSCGEYQRVLKSTDPDYHLEFAKRAFEEKKYTQAATALEPVVTVFKGTEKAEDALYLLALSNYENKDYETSGTWFKTYYNRFPKGKYTELARYFCGYGYYLDSPDPQLDQTGTLLAIQELQSFLDYFPR